jgi:hypothetical protein
VRDGVLMRLIGKWLNAGVMEDGGISYPDSGSLQGGVVAPLLSNVFLHYVLDLWFERDVKPRMRDRAFLIRFADDFVIGFRAARHARRVMEVIPKRLSKYGLTIHPTKSRLVPFRSSSPWANDDRGEPDEPAGTFDLGEIPCHPSSLPARSRSHCPFDSQARSEAMMRGTGCANARTYGSVGAPGR